MKADQFFGIDRDYINNDYIEAIEKSGHIPLLLPVIHNLDDVKYQMAGLDGLIIPGGSDIDPSLYHEEMMEETGTVLREVDLYDIALIQAADEAGLPVFGICKGEQALNVAFGGTLYQSQRKQREEETYKHFQQAPRYNPAHDIQIRKDSFLYSVLGESTRVNSFHHQSVKDVAPGFSVTALASDGIIEGIEKDQGTFMCGVQFHPEMMARFDNEEMIQLFRAFGDLCLKRNQ